MFVAVICCTDILYKELYRGVSFSVLHFSNKYKYTSIFRARTRSPTLSHADKADRGETEAAVVVVLQLLATH